MPGLGLDHHGRAGGSRILLGGGGGYIPLDLHDSCLIVGKKKGKSTMLPPPEQLESVRYWFKL